MIARPCSDGCGRQVRDFTQECYPIAPWDTPGLPKRRMEERCGQHALCAFRDDDPNLCPNCHDKRDHHLRRVGPCCSKCQCPKSDNQPPQPRRRNPHDHAGITRNR